MYMFQIIELSRFSSDNKEYLLKPAMHFRAIQVLRNAFSPGICTPTHPLVTLHLHNSNHNN